MTYHIIFPTKVRLNFEVLGNICIRMNGGQLLEGSKKEEGERETTEEMYERKNERVTRDEGADRQACGAIIAGFMYELLIESVVTS